jgi:hypothetical protein
LAKLYREIFGAHYPAMALVQVVRLGRKGGAGRNRGDGSGTALNESPHGGPDLLL